MSIERTALPAPQIGKVAWAFASQAVQAVVQAAAFLLVAKSLRVSDLGIFVSVGAITSILSPFAGMGAPNLLIKKVSRNKDVFLRSWSLLVTTTIWSGTLLSLIAIPACWLVLHRVVPWYAIVVIVIGDLLVWRWISLIALTLQGLGEIREKSQMEILVTCARLGTAIVLFALPASLHNIRSWLFLYGISALGVTGISISWAISKFGKASLSETISFAELKEGFGFVLSPTTQTINNDADKFLLARVAGLSAVGVYGTGYRILSLAFLPVQALLTVTYPQFFLHGKRGVRHTAQFAIKLLPAAISYSISASVILFFSAPLIEYILGSSYHETGQVVRALAILPLLKTLQFFFADALTGADLQKHRVWLQAIAAGCNILLNLVLIPGRGWRGAAVATLISDGLLAVVLILTVLIVRNRPQPAPLNA